MSAITVANAAATDIADEDELLELAFNALEGIGVAASGSVGTGLLQRAADLGSMHAYFELGNIYAHGHYGIARDGKRAAQLYQRAADGGHAIATVCLGLGCLDGTLPKKKSSEALALLESVSVPSAQYRLGCIYHNMWPDSGPIVPKDLAKAAKLYALPASDDICEALLRCTHGGKACGRCDCRERLTECHISRYNLACLASLRGEASEAFEWLSKAVDAGLERTLCRNDLQTDDELAALRSDMRWATLLRRLK